MTDQLLIDLTLLKEHLDTEIYKTADKVYVPMKLEADFFDIIVKHSREIRQEPYKSVFLGIQNKLMPIWLNIVVGGKSNDLKNFQMVYNAACTEYAIYSLIHIPCGGGGVLDHLYTHSGIGINSPDFISNKVHCFSVENSSEYYAGPTFEVKDYFDLSSARTWFDEGAETSVFHNADHVFIHIIKDNSFYIAENKKYAKFYKLINFQPKYDKYRQVTLKMDSEGFLCVWYK